MGDFSAFGSADVEKKETKDGENDNKKEIKNAVRKHYLMLTIKSDMCEINIKQKVQCLYRTERLYWWNLSLSDGEWKLNQGGKQRSRRAGGEGRSENQQREVFDTSLSVSDCQARYPVGSLTCIISPALWLPSQRPKTLAQCLPCNTVTCTITIYCVQAQEIHWRQKIHFKDP